MSKFFRITGVAFIIIGAIYFLVSARIMLIGAGIAFLNIIFCTFVVAVGMGLIALADLLTRVELIEEKLNIYEPESDEDLQQTTCPDCGREYDFDYPKCPYCGSEEQ